MRIPRRVVLVLLSQIGSYLVSQNFVNSYSIKSTFLTLHLVPRSYYCAKPKACLDHKYQTFFFQYSWLERPNNGNTPLVEQK